MTLRDERDPKALESDADRALIERLSASYRPDPLTPNRRAALRLEIEERAQRSRWRLREPLFAGIAAAGAAAALAFALVGGDSAPPSASPRVVQTARTEGARTEGARTDVESVEIDWVGDVFAAAEAEGDEIEAALPDEYTRIAMYFLDEE